MNIAIHLVVVISLVVAFNKDYIKGLCLSALLLVLLPSNLGIVIPGALPNLTAHRCVLITLFLYWVSGQKYKNIDQIPFKNLFVLLLLANMISMAFSVYLTPSFKSFLSFCVENFLVYIIISTSLKNDEDVLRLFNTIFKALCIGAICIIIEKFLGFSILQQLPALDGNQSKAFGHYTYFTLEHSIFVGIFTAVALTIGIATFERQCTQRNKYINFALVFLMGAGLYFSFSRGPWLAAMISLFGVFLYGTTYTKKIIVGLVIAAAIAIIIKPGVRDTIVGYYTQTFNTESIEGASFYYRFELWRVAWNQIAEDPFRLLFGYGLEYHRNADLYGFFAAKGRGSSFHSWDSEFACLLMELGFIGLFLFIILYSKVTLHFFKYAREETGPMRDIIVAITGCCLIFVFMMTNVKMFSAQTLYLFYILMSIGVSIIAIQRQLK